MDQGAWTPANSDIFPTAGDLSKDQANAPALAATAKKLSVKAAWDFGGHVEDVLQPQPAQSFHIGDYNFNLPPMLAWQAISYGDKLQQLHMIEIPVTRRTGPSQENVNFWLTGNVAVAGIGSVNGGGVETLNMPIQALDTWDYFEFPWALPHEMLHNFGYDHSPAMYRLQEMAGGMFNGLRWTAVDNPGWLPGSSRLIPYPIVNAQ